MIFYTLSPIVLPLTFHRSMQQKIVQRYNMFFKSTTKNIKLKRMGEVNTRPRNYTQKYIRKPLQGLDQ